MQLKHHNLVYEDREDSWLLQSIIETLDLKGKRVIDLGTGTGIQAITAAKKGAEVFALDINPIACSLAHENSNLNNADVKILCSDLFTAIKESEKFDFIFYNSPYLPDEEPRDLAWSGGEQAVLRFIEQAKNHVSKNGRIIFVFSSLTGLKLKNVKILASQKFFQEIIYIGELTRD